MGASRCLKLLLLVSLIPLALRATSLLLGGHGHGHAAPAPSRRSWDRTIATTAASGARGSLRSRPCHQLAERHRRRRAESALAAPDGARRPRTADGGGDWFDDDKRLAPTGSNPLHNLR